MGIATILFSGVALIVVAILLNANAYCNLPRENKNVSAKGLVLSVISGCLMGLFYKYIADSMFHDFQVPEAGKLSPYTAVVVFAAVVFLSNFLFNTLLMKWPFVGAPVTYGDYFRGTFRSHQTDIFGGVIWCLGMLFNIIAADQDGPAISYGLGQGATYIADIWGIYIWQEFKQALKGTYKLLNLMLLYYSAGLFLLIVAR